MISSEDSIICSRMILKFTYHKLIIDGKEEEFDFYVPSKVNKKIRKWCKENCKDRYVIKKLGCWFQTRVDAEAFTARG